MKYVNSLSLVVMIFIACSCQLEQTSVISNNDIAQDHLYNSRDYDSAIYFAEKSLEQNLGPQIDYYSHFIISYAHDRRKEYINSLNHLMHALVLIPQDEIYNNNRGLIHLNIGKINKYYSDFETSQKHYELALKFLHQNNSPDAYYNLGNMYRKKGELTNAAKFYKEGFQIANELGQLTNMAKLNNSMGIMNIRIGDFNEGRERLFATIEQRNFKQYNKYAGKAYHNIGHSYLVEKKYEKAVEYYLKALEIKENEAERFVTHKDLGECYNKLGKIILAKSNLDLALGSFDRVDNIPKNFHLFRLVSQNYRLVGNNVLADSFIDQYIQHNENYRTVRENITQNNNRVQVRKFMRDFYDELVISNKYKKVWDNLIWMIVVGAILLFLVVIQITKFIRSKRVAKQILIDLRTAARDQSA